MSTTYSHNGDSQAEIAEKANVILHKLFTRSVNDPPFRRKLLDAPKEAIAEFTGRDVSEVRFNMVFVENTPGTMTFVLPDAVDPAAELSAQDLETVAGGSTLACVASALWVTAELIELYKSL